MSQFLEGMRRSGHETAADVWHMQTRCLSSTVLARANQSSLLSTQTHTVSLRARGHKMERLKALTELN